MTERLRQRFLAAVDSAEAYLRRHFPDLERVNAPESGRTWNLTLDIGNEKVPLEVHVSSRFPVVPAKLRVRNPKRFWLRIPHVEENGTLCLLPPGSATNADDPEAGFEFLFGRARDLLGNPDFTDFAQEFESYWREGGVVRRVILLGQSPRPDRDISITPIDGGWLASDDRAQAVRWLHNIDGAPRSSLQKTTVALRLHCRTIVPAQYPSTLGDLLSLVDDTDPLKEAIKDHLWSCSSPKVILCDIGEPSEGVLLGAIELPVLNLKSRKDLRKGFRSARQARELVLNRFLSSIASTKVTRLLVQPISHDYIHTRGGSGVSLAHARLCLVGCGALGSHVAALLSKAGVGRIDLVDPDTLAWDNIGRHLLGATFVGQNKATAVEVFIRSQMPHLNVSSKPTDAAKLLEDSHPFEGTDLVISTTANWAFEHDLNFWGSRDLRAPPIIYGWLEAFAVVGFALLVHPNGGGCLRCGVNANGDFQRSVISSGAAVPTPERRGCGGSYQQFGVSEMLPVAAAVARMAVETLTGEYHQSHLRTWLGPVSDFRRLGLPVQTDWSAISNLLRWGGYYEEEWSTRSGCEHCG